MSWTIVLILCIQLDFNESYKLIREYDLVRKIAAECHFWFLRYRSFFKFQESVAGLFKIFLRRNYLLLVIWCGWSDEIRGRIPSNLKQQFIKKLSINHRVNQLLSVPQSLNTWCFVSRSHNQSPSYSISRSLAIWPLVICGVYVTCTCNQANSWGWRFM